jgi:uncharacterized protein (TIGR03905 family)
MYNYETTGTCSTDIHFEIRDSKIYNLSFDGGCNGNLKAISILVEGHAVSEIISQFKGLTCGRKPTSCADQLACALEQHSAAAQ